MKRVNIAGWCRAAMLAVPMFVLGSGFVDTGVSYLNPSGGKVVPGEWNKNFDSALAMADKENIPLVAVYGGASCGACGSYANNPAATPFPSPRRASPWSFRTARRGRCTAPDTPLGFGRCGHFGRRTPPPSSPPR